jgi:nitroreductase
MDTFLTIVSKRDTRQYSDRDLPEEVTHRILEAGRLSGSAMNRQPWRFVVVDSPRARERVAETVYAPANVQGARFVVALVGTGGGLDIGRCAQNMMLAAWNEGVASCPNGMPDVAATATALGLAGDGKPVVVLSFGYPATGHTGDRRTPEEWIARAERKPVEELVERI